MLAAKNPAASFSALQYMLACGEEPARKPVERLASDVEWALQVLELLEKNRHENLFPKAKLKQEFIGEADLLQTLKTKDLNVLKCEFQKMVVFEYQGYKQKMAVFKLTYVKDGDKKIVSAFAGPYSVRGDEIVRHGDYTGTTFLEYYPDMLVVLIRQHIKKMRGD
jgi:hypothetical protein